MATSPDYLAFLLDLCQHDPDVTSRAMMGEYLLYYQGKLVGGLYDNRLLVKPRCLIWIKQPTPFLIRVPSP